MLTLKYKDIYLYIYDVIFYNKRIIAWMPQLSIYISIKVKFIATQNIFCDKSLLRS